MNNPPTIAAIIPVKAVSKRLPGKNLKDLLGKPLMAHILETVAKVDGIDRVIVSTESEEIKKIAERCGAEVPFIRPEALTADEVTSQEVLVHALDELKQQGYEPDYVLLLYPTSPLLSAERIEEAVRLIRERGSDSVVSGYFDKGHYWTETTGGWKRLYPTELVNSQYQKPLFKENGAIYMTKSAILRKQLVADVIDVVLMEKDENIDIDYPEDFARVEMLMQKAKQVD